MSDPETSMAQATADALTLAEMTAGLIVAYVSRNRVQPSDMPAVIATLHASLAGLGSASETAPEPTKQLPAVPIKKSIADDYIISLEDGRKFKSMKRYLSILGMTPDQYRAKWGLPHDYPMVAPAYAKARSELARSHSFGRKSSDAALPGPDEVLNPPVVPEIRKLKHPTR